MDSWLTPVTTFHPMRPPLRESSVESLRAMWAGGSVMVDMVATSPSREVALAMADRATSGSPMGKATASSTARAAIVPFFSG